ncbi:hypothetical protein P152DRAFT_392425 [Eremomyces bilateralis CBS 781.70]|uniref:Protein kinase domain-containing protein n=1 Tax=Eremomyces bilateralis CBS 781.70 TaxID=1392243 RepID=A0A6G1G9D8_9PEZI|nr:uncharacterized protein P152DRAFT_392425 [Eremomyces bilateralis CBS 781.70]KAF1814697.1 hypothetical protein P152DRAFT_392425 [Eremomyces bilateralis CBS 781.70]
MTSRETKERPQSPPPPWSVLEFTFSNRNTDSELVITCCGKRFSLHLFADNFTESPRLKERYLFFLEVAEHYELDGLTVEDFYDWAAEPLFPLFRNLPHRDKDQTYTLHDFLFPESFVYTLRAVSERLVPIPYEESKGGNAPRFGVHLADELCSPFKTLLPSDVQICEEPVIGPPSGVPGKVRLKDGILAFFKFIRCGDKHFLENELNNYKAISEANPDDSLRISRLYGLVRDEAGVVFGLLLAYIDCGRVTLSCAVKPDIAMPLREKWIVQLQYIINQLHAARIVWGDAKPDNVLIDRNEDAWIIDFGGGYTEGWVPKELAGTVEGDLHALKKIVEFVSA